MCVLFLYVAKCNCKSLEKNKIKMILASNRDEIFNRQTKMAEFWPSNPNILAGQDMEEMGTWLGITKTGKISVLLNISSDPKLPKKKSRGELVTGFLRSAAEVDPFMYCNSLLQAEDFDIFSDYKPFNLITINLVKRCHKGDARKESTVPEVCYMNNIRADNKAPTLLTNTGESLVIGFGNTPYPLCSKKVDQGQRMFSQILCKLQDDQKMIPKGTLQQLKKELLGFLQCNERFYPDPVTSDLAKEYCTGVSEKTIEKISSIFVRDPTMQYGTRTHTIIIVDSDNNVNYHEWTLEELSNFDPSEQKKYTENEFNFKIAP